MAVGDGTLYVMGGTPADDPSFTEEWHLYRMDTNAQQGSFELLRSFEHFGEEVYSMGALAYLHGNLYFVDCTSDKDDEDLGHMRIRRFDDDYHLVDAYELGLTYGVRSFLSGPMVASTDNSIYVSALNKADSESTSAQVVLCGLERVDIAADGSITCTDLSSSVAALEASIDELPVCMAACDNGVFLIGQGLDPLLSDGAPRTDTFFLKNGESEFTPYERTLSNTNVESPTSVWANGWLYAFGTSAYEDSPQFVRATRVEYNVSFVNDDGSMLQSVWTLAGEKPTYTGETPTKAATAQYTYTFAGWYPAITEALTDAQYRATYDTKLNRYNITYVLEGGTLNGKTGTVTETFDYGTTITLPAPTREGYTFSYWKGSSYKAGESYTVTGAHTFAAVWEKSAAPAPGKKDSPASSQSKTLPKTGDALDGTASTLALAGAGALALAVALRRRRQI